jgi:hypothetical protein
MNKTPRSQVLYIVLAVVFLIIAVLLIIILIWLVNKYQEDPPTLFNPYEYIYIWGDYESVRGCVGYEFPAINSTTPGIAKYDVNNYQRLPGVLGGYLD